MAHDIHRSRKCKAIDAMLRRLDNAARNVDGRKPLSLIEKEERVAQAAALHTRAVKATASTEA